MAPQPVTAAIVWRGDRVLLTRRGPGDRHAGKWEFPGGKVEPGESPGQCLARELREELGVGATVGGLVASSLFTYAHGAIELLAFEVELAAGDFVLTVHDRAEWVPVAELTRYDLLPADIPIARRLATLPRVS